MDTDVQEESLTHSRVLSWQKSVRYSGGGGSEWILAVLHRIVNSTV